ncbi:MAG: hypothetical protein RLN86_03970 [Cyclobacteriaceae bacterium]
MIRLLSWEYWPFGIVQAPLILYWLWLSLRTRSLFFFSASNPGILTGGMFGESKFEILAKIPKACKPTSILIEVPCDKEEVLRLMQSNHLSFPVIFKPDLGERGWMVKRIKHESDLDNYLSTVKTNFIIQEYVDLPLEFSVFYVRFPERAEGTVTSLTEKEMLKIEGNGNSTIKELILDLDRAKLQWPKLKTLYEDRLDEVLDKGETLELISIGNHCLGTKFINRNSSISEEMSKAFDMISKEVDGFYFGRYDLRTKSIKDLERGKVMIMELNGCGAEPSHIYHPGASIIKAVRDLFVHWRTIYQISKTNHKRGVAYLPFSDGVKIFKRFKAATAQ